MFFCAKDNNNTATWAKRTTSEREYLVENARLSLASYRAIWLGTTPNCSFPVRLKIKKLWSHFNSVCSNFWNLGCSILDQGLLQTLFTVKMTLSHFFHARSHSFSRGCWVQLSVNHTQPAKPLNNAKYRTATMSLRSPFHPGKTMTTDVQTNHFILTHAEISLAASIGRGLLQSFVIFCLSIYPCVHWKRGGAVGVVNSVSYYVYIVLSLHMYRDRKYARSHSLHLALMANY